MKGAISFDCYETGDDEDDFLYGASDDKNQRAKQNMTPLGSPKSPAASNNSTPATAKAPDNTIKDILSSIGIKIDGDKFRKKDDSSLDMSEYSVRGRKYRYDMMQAYQAGRTPPQPFETDDNNSFASMKTEEGAEPKRKKIDENNIFREDSPVETVSKLEEEHPKLDEFGYPTSELMNESVSSKNVPTPTEANVQFGNNLNNLQSKNVNNYGQNTNPMENMSPMSGNMNPMANNMNPMANNMNPMANNMNPMANNMNPMANNMNPMANNMNPMANNMNPMANNMNPMANNMNPMANNMNPMANNMNPMANNMNQMTSNMFSNMGNVMGNNMNNTFGNSANPDMMNMANSFGINPAMMQFFKMAQNNGLFNQNLANISNPSLNPSAPMPAQTSNIPQSSYSDINIVPDNDSNPSGGGGGYPATLSSPASAHLQNRKRRLDEVDKHAPLESADDQEEEEGITDIFGQFINKTSTRRTSIAAFNPSPPPVSPRPDSPEAKKSVRIIGPTGTPTNIDMVTIFSVRVGM